MSRTIVFGLVLVIAGTMLAAIAELLLVLTITTSSHAGYESGDRYWALVSAVPPALLLVLGVVGAIRSTRMAANRSQAIALIVSSLLLVLPAILGGLWAMLEVAGSDDKWVCICAGGLATLSAFVVAAAGGVFASAAGASAVAVQLRIPNASDI